MPWGRGSVWPALALQTDPLPKSGLVCCRNSAAVLCGVIPSNQYLFERSQMGVGKFILHRFNGDEEYEVQRATILAVHDEDGLRLWFEAENDGVCLKSLPDTASLHGHPKAEVAVGLKKIEPTRLAGKKFSVPAAYDHKIDNHVASIYYVEHEDLDDNLIEIDARDGDVFQVRWSGTTTDINYYDSSKPRTRVEIVAAFKFKDMAKWSAGAPSH